VRRTSTGATPDAARRAGDAYTQVRLHLPTAPLRGLPASSRPSARTRLLALRFTSQKTLSLPYSPTLASIPRGIIDHPRTPRRRRPPARSPTRVSCARSTSSSCASAALASCHITADSSAPRSDAVQFKTDLVALPLSTASTYHRSWVGGSRPHAAGVAAKSALRAAKAPRGEPARTRGAGGRAGTACVAPGSWP
jgi:hypothetical protein